MMDLNLLILISLALWLFVGWWRQRAEDADTINRERARRNYG